VAQILSRGMHATQCDWHYASRSKVLKKLIEGWEGKPKGLVQVLWTRGYIHPVKHLTNFYCLNNRKRGEDTNSSSLRCLMGCCLDFKHEETALQLEYRFVANPSSIASLPEKSSSIVGPCQITLLSCAACQEEGMRDFQGADQRKHLTLECDDPRMCDQIFGKGASLRLHVHNLSEKPRELFTSTMRDINFLSVRSSL
jgi:hypothetical protein